MKFPTPPPNDDEILGKAFDDKRKRWDIYDLSAILDQIPYDHWEKMRFRRVPKPFTARDLWAVAKLRRRLARRWLLFRDKHDAPFSYVPIGEFQRTLHDIDSNARGMIGVPGGVISSEERDVYLQKSLIEEPFSSSVLEGAATTREIARRMIEEARPPKTLDERMVLNNYEAMNFVRESCNEPLTPARILEIHRILTKDTLERPEMVGALRTVKDDVRVVDSVTGETLHNPPNADELPKRLEELCDFANADSGGRDFLHPIIRAILLHFKLAYDHPFWDGNGRCARALFYWCALRHGYWLLEYVSISAVIRQAPVKYGQAFLYTETDEGDVTYFIDHQLDVIEKSISDLQAYLVKKSKELSGLGKALGMLDKQLNRRQLPLVQDAIKHPKAKYTIADLMELHGVSYLTARSDLDALAKMGFLRKTKHGARLVYLVPDNLRDRLERRAAG